jgi:hypothetical protein
MKRNLRKKLTELLKELHLRGSADPCLLSKNGRNNCHQREFIIDAPHRVFLSYLVKTIVCLKTLLFRQFKERKSGL